MAFVALQPRVLAFEKVAGFLVVEFFRIPLDQRKIRPVVIGVAAHALLAGPGGNVVRRVEATLGGYARADVRMASNAAELRLAPADLVAVGAVHGAVKKLVLLCKRAGRDLRVSLQGPCAKEKCADEIPQQPGRPHLSAAPKPTARLFLNSQIAQSEFRPRSLTAGFYSVCQCPRFEGKVYQDTPITQQSPEGHAQIGGAFQVFCSPLDVMFVTPLAVIFVTWKRCHITAYESVSR